MQRERRKYPRVKIHKIPVKMEKASDDDKELKEGIVKGISVGGVGISLKGSVENESLVVLDFILDKGFEFSDIQGKVVRVEEGIADTIIGVQFVDISEDNRTRLKKYVGIKQGEKNNKDVLVQNDTIIYR